MLLAFTFSMQGWGNIAGGIVTLVVLYAYEGSLKAEDTDKLNGAWRIIAGVIIVPCLGTLYQRIVLPESQKYKNARALQEDPDLLKKGLVASDMGEKNQRHTMDSEATVDMNGNNKYDNVPIGGTAADASAEEAGMGLAGVTANRKAALSEFIEYFSEWRHAKLLFGTASTWFLLDIAFYGINLNQTIVLTSVGFNSTASTWAYLHDNTVGNLIITAAGYLPGYWVTIVSKSNLPYVSLTVVDCRPPSNILAASPFN